MAGLGTGVAISRTAAPGDAAVRDALHGDGIAAAVFGERVRTAVPRLHRLLGRPPAEPYAVAKACRIDHVTRWPGLSAFFRRGRFVGYRSDGPELATGRGLRIGDTLARAHRLYGRAFRRSAAQGGSWSARTSRGRLMGYADGTVATIEAGDVGCPAMTP